MDDCKLKTTLQQILETSLSGIKDDPLMEQRVLLIAHERGEKKMKKKASITIALALVLVLTFGSISVALGMNLFEWFGQDKQQQRLNVIALDSELDPPISITISSEEYGNSTITFTNAYYDGDALLIGYTIENSEFIDYFTPSAEQLTQMIVDNESPFRMFMSEKELQFTDEYEQAVQNGTPFGMVRSTVRLNNDWYSDGDINLGSWKDDHEDISEDVLLFYCDFFGLPEEAQHKESLSVITKAIRDIDYLYFDGQNTYKWEKEIEIMPLEIAVDRSETETRIFEGTTVVNGVDATITVAATAVRMTALIDAHDTPIPPVPDDSELFLDLSDGDGQELTFGGFMSPIGKTKLFFSFDGMGELPETLIGWLGITSWEGTEYTKISLYQVR